MEVLKPDLIWIEGRCYRINPQNSSQIENSERPEEYEYEEESMGFNEN